MPDLAFDSDKFYATLTDRVLDLRGSVPDPDMYDWVSIRDELRQKSTAEEINAVVTQDILSRHEI